MVKVLLVDDEPAILRSTSLLLTDMGFDVHEASRADAIVEAIRTVQPDIILQDLRMPGLDLPSVLREIRSDPATARVPVILFSASLDASQVAEDLHVGLLEKPVRPAIMASAIRAAMAASS